MSNTLKDKMGIYQIVNLIDGKKYVGSSKNLYNRKAKHFYNLKNNKHGNCHLQNAFNKYGEDNFSFEVIEFVNTEDELLPREQYYIELYQVCDKDKGYNLIVDAVRHAHSDETKQKMSLAKKGKTRSEETKLKISLAKKGKTLSEETKLKIGLAKKGSKHHMYGKRGTLCPNYGKTHSEETKLKMSLAKKGKIFSEEAKLKMSLAHKGKTLSEETKLKMSLAKSKKVICIETGVIYNCMLEASKINNINQSSISLCCKGRQKTAGGYHWQYYNPS